MSLWSAHHVPLVDSVLHPTDFSSASDTAFAHALARRRFHRLAPTAYEQSG